MSSSTSGASRVPAFVREKLKKIDQFVSPKMDENSRSELGGFFSVLVPIGLLIYSIYLVVAFSDRPYTATSSVVTARGLGTVALPITCEFQYGCRLKEIQLSEDGAACMGEGRTLAYKQTATIQLCTGKAVLVTILNTWLFAEGVQTVQYKLATDDTRVPNQVVYEARSCDPEYFKNEGIVALGDREPSTFSHYEPNNALGFTLTFLSAAILVRKDALERDTQTPRFNYMSGWTAEFVNPGIPHVLFRAKKTQEPFLCIDEATEQVSCYRPRLASKDGRFGAAEDVQAELSKLVCAQVGSVARSVLLDEQFGIAVIGCFGTNKLASLEGGLSLSYSFGKGVRQLGIVVEKVSKDDAITDYARDYASVQLTDASLDNDAGTCFEWTDEVSPVGILRASEVRALGGLFNAVEDVPAIDSLLIGLAGFHFQTNFTRPGDVLSLPGEIGGFKGTLETVFGLLLTAIGVVMQRFFAKAADAPREKPDGAISMKNPMATAL